MAENNEGYQFEYRFSRGQEMAYLVSIHGSVEVETPDGTRENLMHIEMEILQKVEEVKDDQAFLSMVVRSAKVFNGSEASPLPEEGQKSTLTMDKLGNVEFTSGAQAQQGNQFTQLVFPRRKIHPGKFWFQETSPQKNFLAQARTKYTLAGFENVGRKNCAVFDSELVLASDTGNVSNPQASSTGKIYFCPEVGAIVKTVADTSFQFLMPVGEKGEQTTPTRTSLHTEMRLLMD